MILYQLKCAGGHQFEAWFKDGATYDAQARDHHILCPRCSGTEISKAIMSPNISRSRSKSREPEVSAPSDLVPHVRAREVAEKILEDVDAIRLHVENNFENVGERFAEEARRIHYGETDEREIYGEASEQEVIDLDDEGVTVFRLPGQRSRKN